MRYSATLLLFVFAMNTSMAQKFYVGANISMYSNHFSYQNSPNRYQPTFTKFALFPNSGINFGYKFDAKNSSQLNISFLPFNENESADQGSAFPTDQYGLTPVSTNFNFRYLRKVTQTKFLGRPLLVNITGGAVVQLNPRASRRTLYTYFFSPDDFGVISTSSKTFILGQIGVENEWMHNNYSVILAYNFFLGGQTRILKEYTYFINGTEFHGLRNGDGYGMNITLGLRFYFGRATKVKQDSFFKNRG
jgi:hypothetical protein